MKKRFLVIIAIGLLVGIVSIVPGYPPVTHPFFEGVARGRVEIMAHGAGQGVAPTNTVAALKIAQAQGADILEVDVQLTRDNILILHHDDTLDRTTNMSGPVAAKTWAEIQAADTGLTTKVARLDAALAAFPTSRWNIEIKNPSSVAAQVLCQDITKAGLTDKVLVASFHDDAMAAFRQDCPRVATSMAPEEIRTFLIAAHLRLSRFVKTPAVAVQVPVSEARFDLTDARFIAALKSRNIKLHYWTINDPAQMRDLIARGADGLLTDYVVRGQAARLPVGAER